MERSSEADQTVQATIADSIAAIIKPPKGKKSAPSMTISIPRLMSSIVRIDLVGTTELICHNLTAKGVREIFEGKDGVTGKKKVARDPKAEYEAAFYPMPGGRYGFPGQAFKLAAVEACRHIQGIDMIQALQAFHVVDPLVQIKGKPHMREDVVRIGGKGPGTGTPSLRYRPGFERWSATLRVRIIANILSAEQVVTLFDWAGATVGIGEWRPGKRGTHGLFEVKR